MNSQASPNWPLALFHKTCAESPAYQQWINAQGINPTDIQSMADFKKLPIIDKQYLLDNQRKSLFPGGKLPVSASCSSGSSGRPTYWFRSEQDDIGSAKGYQYLIEKVLQIKKTESVLALVCFAMGSWVAGTLTVDCLKLVAAEGFNLTIFPAGIDREDGLNALQHLGPEYDHILIYGYPPLLLDFVRDAHQRKIPMGEKVKLIPAGDKNSEKWRETIAGLAGCPQEQVVSFYGSADALYMACETPLTYAIKKEALQNPDLYHALFGETHVANMPGLYQYDHQRLYLEEVNQELILTIDRTLALIRYNLHDRVRLIDHPAMAAILAAASVGQEKIDQHLKDWDKPFVVVSSRTDVAVNYYGINIYYDQLKNITEAPALEAILSGNYMAYIENLYDISEQRLYLELELNPGIETSAELIHRAQATALEVLQASSTEYRKLLGDLQQKAMPVVRVVRHGELQAHHAHTGIFAVKGKKPRMINNQK